MPILAPRHLGQPEDASSPFERYYWNQFGIAYADWLGQGSSVPFERFLLKYDKPGGDWTEIERWRVTEWLAHSPQLEGLLTTARYHLGAGAAPQDAEDAAQDWFLRRLKYVISSYNPFVEKEKRFWRYALLSLKQHCHSWAKRQHRREQREVRGVMYRSEDAPEPVEIEIVDSGSDPLKDAEREELGRHLQDCLNQLSERDREIILLRDFKGLSYEEILQTLGIENSATARKAHHVALRRLRGCLLSKGIAHDSLTGSPP